MSGNGRPVDCVALLVEVETRDHHTSSSMYESMHAVTNYCQGHEPLLNPIDMIWLHLNLGGTLMDPAQPAQRLNQLPGPPVLVLGPCPDPLPHGVHDLLRTWLAAGAVVHSVEWGELTADDLHDWRGTGEVPGRTRRTRFPALSLTVHLDVDLDVDAVPGSAGAHRPEGT
jgi:hypothetical protein